MPKKPSCYNISLSEFINAVCDGLWLYSAVDWDILQEQHAELSKDKNISIIFRLRKDIAVAENKCKIIDVIVSGLEISDSPALWDILRHPHLNIKANNLTLVKSYAKRYKTQLDDLNEQLKLYISDKKTTRADFDEKLVILGKFTGYRIDKNKTMISEYIAICNQYDDFVNTSKAAAESKNGRGLYR